jgi:hypothetical protein
MLIYRAGSGTTKNMTPRPDKDTVGGQRGLSAFEHIDMVPRATDADVKVQVIETDALVEPLGFVRHGDGHVSVVPMAAGKIDDTALLAWAATREAAAPSPLTAKVLAAIVDQKKVLKKGV